MKKVFLFGAVALSLSLVSCNKEEQTEKVLDGTWGVSSITGTLNISTQGQTITGTLANGAGEITLNRADATGKINMMYDMVVGQFGSFRDTIAGDITVWNNSDKDVSMTVKGANSTINNLGFTIVTSAKDAQNWTSKTRQVDPSTGDFQELNYNINLTKK